MAVRFDHAAANDAVRELVLTANSIDAMLSLLATDVPLVTQDWTGRHRTTFDAETTHHSVTMVTLAESLRATAAAIRAEQHLAQVAQIQEAAEADEDGGP